MAETRVDHNSASAMSRSYIIVYIYCIKVPEICTVYNAV